MWEEFTTAGGEPNPRAAFSNAYLLAAIYAQDNIAINNWRAVYGATEVTRNINPDTFNPDYVVMKCTVGSINNYLIAACGTTNKTQWCAHLLSNVLPYPSDKLHCDVMLSFYTGWYLINKDLEDNIPDNYNTRLWFTSHSYGAASLRIGFWDWFYKDRLKRQINSMSFGEPKGNNHSTLIEEYPADADWRIVGEGDPVPTMAVEKLTAFAWAGQGLGLLYRLVAGFHHFGTSKFLDHNGGTFNFPIVGEVVQALNSLDDFGPVGSSHYISEYLRRAMKWNGVSDA